MKDYYQIIGVSPYATEAEIKRCFRKLAVLYHPDKNHSPEAEGQFKEINEAYEVLSDPVKRAEYNRLLANPVLAFQKPEPYHRDPAYHRRNYVYREPKQTLQQLMAEYLPYFRWVCWVALFFTCILAIDYSLPFKDSREEVVGIERVYRTGRSGGRIYDHDVLLTKQGSRIVLFDDDLSYFEKTNVIDVQHTALFSKMVTASIPSGAYKIRVASVYGTLSFMPIILFITSLLGVSIRKSVEFPFNLTIVSFVLLIIVLYLLIS